MASHPITTDYYDVLGVPRTASTQDIKASYRTLALVRHPDKGGSEALMKQLNEAYETLIDPEKRARHDHYSASYCNLSDALSFARSHLASLENRKFQLELRYADLLNDHTRISNEITELERRLEEEVAQKRREPGRRSQEFDFMIRSEILSSSSVTAPLRQRMLQRGDVRAGIVALERALQDTFRDIREQEARIRQLRIEMDEIVERVEKELEELRDRLAE